MFQWGNSPLSRSILHWSWLEVIIVGRWRVDGDQEWSYQLSSSVTYNDITVLFVRIHYFIDRNCRSSSLFVEELTCQLWSSIISQWCNRPFARSHYSIDHDCRSSSMLVDELTCQLMVIWSLINEATFKECFTLVVTAKRHRSMCDHGSFHILLRWSSLAATIYSTLMIVRS